MKRYILTGAPGCGKTSVIRALEMRGYGVVNEAATDIIAIRQQEGVAAPWERSSFIDDIVQLQTTRQLDLRTEPPELYFYDRSPICTYALALYLGFEPSTDLLNEIERIQKNDIYEKRVFFLENLGFITNTDARKISFEESLKFEQLHRDAYAKFKYQLVLIPAGSIDERVNIIVGSDL